MTSYAASPAGSNPSLSTWAGFGAMCLGMFMAVLDIQVVATSLPTIQAALDMRPDQMRAPDELPHRRGRRHPAHGRAHASAWHAVAVSGLPRHRHLVHLVVLRRFPAAYAMVARILTHRSITTTIQNYSYLDGEIAMRAYQRLVEGVQLGRTERQTLDPGGVASALDRENGRHHAYR
jgi:hypothetical protein